ncbi:MAG TPA: VWA domain-containing protein [Terriglobales bacterium]|nr:VWA domain-containing protein [Terriglobales bacterium]
MLSRTLLFRRVAVCLTLLLFLLPVGLQAQSSSPPSGQDQDQPANPDQNVPTFKSQVNVVNLFFNVKDKHGALVPNLAKADFQVFEDGKPQTIKYFSKDSEEPLTLGILIDSSASQTRVLDMEKEVGANFLREVLRPKDLAFVISFDVEVDLLQDYTNEARLLRTALNKAKINAGTPCTGVPGIGGGPFPGSCSPKGTLLYDAVYLASNDKLAKEVGRKAMILLTDGEDQGSQERIQDAIEAAQKSDSIVYVLLIADRGFYGFGGYSGDREMKKMTSDTGGRVIEVGNKREKLQEAFDEIAKELRTQYNIGYTPTNEKLDGSFRKVEIHTNDKNLRVQARSGYYAIRHDAEAGD